MTEESTTPKYHIKSFGCQMNAYDAQRMGELLVAQGYEATEQPENADLVLLNTCHIREKAAEKVYSDIGRLREMKLEREADGKQMMIGIAGCVAQAEGKEIFKRAPVVDLVVGPQSYHRLDALLAKAKTGRRAIDTEFPVEEKFAHLPHTRANPNRAPSAFLTVQEGCDKFCTFCVVPYTRGAEVSRAPEAILAEAQKLIDHGVQELTLLGQNVNAYHGVDATGTTWSLARLLYALAELPQVSRLRYMTSHPRDMAQDLIHAHRDLPQLMPYLHLPVQSGSDRILKAMNRGHTAQHYVELMQHMRDIRPDIVFSSDFIVGFPGETDEDFEDTLRVIDTVKFHAPSYSFKYSPRPGTPAAEHKTQVPEAVMQARLLHLQQILAAQQTYGLAQHIGTTQAVLFEKIGREAGQIIGRTPHAYSIHVVATPALIGTIQHVRVVDQKRNSLGGVVLL